MAGGGSAGARGRQGLEGIIVVGEISWEVEMDRGNYGGFFFTAPHRTIYFLDCFSLFPKLMARTSLKFNPGIDHIILL
jgi:hypothetical protein